MIALKTSYYKIFAAFSLMLIISSCSNTKFLQEGQILYTGAKISIKNDTLSKKEKSNLKEALQDQLRPKPNSSFLGLRPRLYIYNITKEPKKQKGIRYWLKYKIGEKPVLLGDVDREFNKKIIVNYSENKGFFNAKASSDTISKNKQDFPFFIINQSTSCFTDWYFCLQCFHNFPFIRVIQIGFLDFILKNFNYNSLYINTI